MFESKPALLRIENLSVEYGSGARRFRALDRVSFQVRPGESVGIVGESGSGKSQIALAVMRLLPRAAHVSGKVDLQERDLLRMSEREIGRLRGSRLACVFQEPSECLSPHLRIGTQLTEVLSRHCGIHGLEAKRRALHALTAVRLAEPETCFAQYPHELSGGMIQRVAIAMSLLPQPALLVADEPTAALDATTRMEILPLLISLGHSLQIALIFISHDINEVARVADQTIVLYAGRIMEVGPTFEPAGKANTSLYTQTARMLACTGAARTHTAEIDPRRVAT